MLTRHTLPRGLAHPLATLLVAHDEGGQPPLPRYLDDDEDEDEDEDDEDEDEDADEFDEDDELDEDDEDDEDELQVGRP